MSSHKMKLVYWKILIVIIFDCLNPYLQRTCFFLYPGSVLRVHVPTGREDGLQGAAG